MNPIRFDRITRLFADRKLSRRQALATTSTALAATALAAPSAGHAVAQEATLEASPPSDTAGAKTIYLFVQSFQGGSIVPTEGAEGRYTVTLDHGLGQTIYFADRPSRDVGALPTTRFLEGLGFPEDNPPNAALIIETDAGETDIAVVELFNPTYDPPTRGVTYDVEVLQNWQEDLDLGLREEPADLATLAASFGTAHLLIDDCPTDLEVGCFTQKDQFREPPVGTWRVDSCWNYSQCMPCEPYYHNQPSGCATQDYWTQKCNQTFSDCQGNCFSLFDWFGGDC
jgi:hypothetical protein